MIELRAYFRDNEEFLPLHHLLLDLIPDGISNLILILIRGGAVNHPVPDINGVLHCGPNLPRFGLENGKKTSSHFESQRTSNYNLAYVILRLYISMKKFLFTRTPLSFRASTSEVWIGNIKFHATISNYLPCPKSKNRHCCPISQLHGGD